MLVDEAGSAGTLELDELREIAVQRGAVLRLIGDWRQSGAVAAGGALRLLSSELDCPELTDVHRFHDPAEAEASLTMRTGGSMDYYHRTGRVHEGDAVDQVYGEWKADRAAGLTSVMMAKSNQCVDELNLRARADLISSGRVTGVEATLRGGRHAAAGDTVLSRQNDGRVQVGSRGDRVRNGDLWDVQRVNPDGSLRVRKAGLPVLATLPAWYVAEHVELGYASTIDRAKGLTTDTGHAVVEPGMSREDLYVSMTRGRQGNHAYLSPGAVDDEHPEPAVSNVEALRRVLAREAARRSPLRKRCGMSGAWHRSGPRR